jgi:hypothetical protein
MSELLPFYRPPVALAESTHVARSYDRQLGDTSKILAESNAPFFKWFKDGTLNVLVHLWELPVMNQFGASTARHEPGGWMRWPEYKDCCSQFTRLPGAPQEGASTISECFLTATRIAPGDEELASRMETNS